ncbi:hypothetical protein [Halobaculum rarum]|uniref:hypothetical protein n=1 Tax=Halobaculum rarum TaxID=3075122 RepID=UPI0032AFDE84
MTHSICTADADEMLPYFQRLGKTLLAPNIEPRARLEQLFETETGEFDLDLGFLTQVDLENETQRFEVVYGSHEILRSGITAPLSKAYCRKTIKDPEGTMAVSDALAEGWEDDLAYETFELGTYLGTTVSIDDELYGTLCFADTDVRDDPIDDKEKALVEMLSKWLEYTRDHWDEPLLRETRIDTIEGRTVSSDAIDSMMSALVSRTRRVVLMTLLDTTETSTATLELQLNHENARIHLYHSQLPRLADAGYIEWDDDTDTISKGPKFPEVEPLVQLLKEYNTALSE